MLGVGINWEGAVLEIYINVTLPGSQNEGTLNNITASISSIILGFYLQAILSPVEILLGGSLLSKITRQGAGI